MLLCKLRIKVFQILQVLVHKWAEYVYKLDFAVPWVF